MDSRIPKRHTSSRTILSQRGVDTRKTGAAIFSPAFARARAASPGSTVGRAAGTGLGGRRGKASGRVIPTKGVARESRPFLLSVGVVYPPEGAVSRRLAILGSVGAVQGSLLGHL